MGHQVQGELCPDPHLWSSRGEGALLPQQDACPPAPRREPRVRPPLGREGPSTRSQELLCKLSTHRCRPQHSVPTPRKGPGLSQGTSRLCPVRHRGHRHWGFMQASHATWQSGSHEDEGSKAEQRSADSHLPD